MTFWTSWLLLESIYLYYKLKLNSKVHVSRKYSLFYNLHSNWTMLQCNWPFETKCQITVLFINYLLSSPHIYFFWSLILYVPVNSHSYCNNTNNQRKVIKWSCGYKIITLLYPHNLNK